MTEFTPFADEATSVGVGGLTIENRTDQIAVYGDLSITRDAQGLADARRLKAILDATVAALEAGPLPDRAAPPPPPDTVNNPFA